MGGSSLTYSALGQATTVTTSGKHISQSGSDISTKTFCRYCSTAELEAIEDTHLLRGGRSGRTYFTTDDYSTILEAQERLALPISPEVKVEFNITNSPNISGPGSVDPDFGQPGGGIQYWSDDPIRVIIKSVLKLE